jgi:hypothetical protein
VAAAANNNNNSNMDPTTTTTTTFVWQLTEYCLQTDSTPPPNHHHSDDWKWWKQAMIWSTVCRNLIRASLVSTLEKKKQNRIVVCCSNNNNNNNTTMMDLEQIAASLLEPKNPTTTPATTSPYVQDLEQIRFARKIFASGSSRLDGCYSTRMERVGLEATVLDPL